MKQFTARHSSQFQSLEDRRLCSVSLTPTINGSTVSSVNFAPVLQNASEPTQVVKLTNKTSGELTGSVQLVLNDQTFEAKAGFGSFDLQKGQSISLTIGELTDQASIRSDTRIRVNFNTADFDQQEIKVTGEVDAPTAKNFSDLGSLKSQTLSGSMTVTKREDNEGTVVYQDADQLYRFYVPTTASISLAFSNLGKNSTINTFLTADTSNGTSKNLTIAERNAALLNLTKAVGDNADSSAATGTASLGKGYYFIYTSLRDLDQSFSQDDVAIKYQLTLSTKVADAGHLTVTGVGGLTIASGEATPSTADGTSFGEVVAGTPETLTFTVKNTGGSDVNIDKSKPFVSGDFTLSASNVPSKLAAGQSASFSIAPINTTAGTKADTVNIGSDAGAYSFSVNGVYDAPIPPGNLTVSGKGVSITSGDSTPSTGDGTSFGSVVAGTPESLSFTVSNTGGTAVNILKAVSVSSGFTVTQALPSVINPGANATLTLAASNTVAGTLSGAVSIVSDVETFNFTVGGIYTPAVVTPPPPKTAVALTATVSAAPVRSSRSVYAFSVTYSSKNGINTASLDSHDVQVKGPGGYVEWARFSSVVTNKNGSVTVTYHLHPVGAAFTKVDNGTYKIYLRSGFTGGIQDKKGNLAEFLDGKGNVLALKSSASFDIAIKK